VDGRDTPGHDSEKTPPNLGRVRDPEWRRTDAAKICRRHGISSWRRWRGVIRRQHPEVLVTISETGPKIEDVRAAIALLAG
jgi:hypothetical protein